jgi:hypothetical protein
MTATPMVAALPSTTPDADRMTLRSELVAIPPSPERVKECQRRIEAIERKLERGEKGEADIREFNAFTGRDYTAYDFQSYWGARSLIDFAREAAWPPPRPVADITREELIEIVRRLANCDFENYGYYAFILNANAAYPDASQLVGSTLRRLGLSDSDAIATPEQIVDHILAHPPLQLPPPE